MAPGQGHAKMNRPPIIPYILRTTARHYCATMREVSGYDPAEETRRRPVVTARTFVAYRLMMEGFTEHAVGSVLGWDHSTVNFYRRKAAEMLHSPGYDAERELWTKFNKAI